ncbi:TetR/AcrR family transcriptional regulator [uncultured Acetobacteroides sp.]|uniref:TetR/AcrR family transcriptional regulator n=1 Tax=uncultured Acetobacteroides sp. TaxID=1760811 RepID=UPI0029F4E409|nr:TetR/AcrR family transcriptional regulator [uncultured Acetobacteroides sp.]
MKSRRLYYLNKITDLLLESRSERIKIEELATAIGVTKKTIYNYFESKQELCECIIDNYIRCKLGLIRTAIHEGQSPFETLLMLSETINKTYNDCYHLLAPLGNIHHTESFATLVEAHQQDIIEITSYTFKKAINEGLFEIGIDTLLAARLYISGIQMLSRSDSLINLMTESKEKHKEIIFYMLKGACTAKGLVMLRQLFDIKVTLSHKLSAETSSTSGSISSELRNHLQCLHPKDAALLL